MKKFKVSGYTKVYYTIEVIAEDENDAKDKVSDYGLSVETYSNETWGMEINDYDYLDNFIAEDIDEPWEDNITEIELLEDNIPDPLADEEDDEE